MPHSTIFDTSIEYGIAVRIRLKQVCDFDGERPGVHLRIVNGDLFVEMPEVAPLSLPKMRFCSSRGVASTCQTPDRSGLPAASAQ
jgi:hypothetical protein